MPRKKLPPWSRHHEHWCAVFNDKPCNCDDDGQDRTRRRRPPPSEGAETPDREELEET